jgi:hypothetical protein
MKLEAACDNPLCPAKYRITFAPHPNADDMFTPMREAGWHVGPHGETVLCPEHAPPKPAPTGKTVKLLAQRWTEHERGWGSRPDGVTPHLDQASRLAYIREFNATHNTAKTVPDEYTQFDGDPVWIDVPEGGEIHAKVLATLAGGKPLWVHSVHQDKDTGAWTVKL